MSLTKNPNVNKWVDEMIALTKPEKVVWIDGSKEQLDALTEEVCSLPDDSWDKMYKLNQDELPGCLYHRTRANDSNNLYSLPDSTIDEILALPADEAAEDISNLILTEIGKTYQQINAGKYEDPTDSAIMHGVLLLTHIGSRKGLDALLELIRQNTEFLDYHFGDLAPEFIYPAIYACGKDDLKAIESYLYEPGYEWYARCEASRALAMIAYNHPEKRDEIIEIFRRLLKSFITRLPVQDGCDSAFAGHVMSDLIGISAKELIPEIKEVYATGYVDDMICGDAESVVRDIEEGNVLSIKEQEFEFPDILKQYAHLKSFEK